jgi:hypothetical protein
VSEIPPLDTPPIPPLPEDGLPWEAPSAGLGSIVPTAVRFITSPIEAFTKMSLTVDLVRPIAYFVTLALVSACISQFWGFILFDTFVGILKTVAGAQFEKIAPIIHKPGAIQLVLGLVITPLVSLIVLFIWSALVHLMLTLLGGANRGFATTLRVMCYAQTTQLAVVLPGLGGFIAFVWRLILEVVGLAQAHKTEGWKAALAVVLPLLLCCVCIAAGIAAFGAAVGQALQQFK